MRGKGGGRFTLALPPLTAPALSIQDSALSIQTLDLGSSVIVEKATNLDLSAQDSVLSAQNSVLNAQNSALRPNKHTGHYTLCVSRRTSNFPLSFKDFRRFLVHHNRFRLRRPY